MCGQAFADPREPEDPEVHGITVIAITPAQGATLPEIRLPYNVQSADDEEFERAQALDVSDYLNRRVAGVSINSAVGNPLQPDVQFRGFTGSPLLGGSEGVSVYVDGVRVNEVFGDSVNWDLIPEEAMSSMTLLTGANPVFGLNTLGGSIQIRTKTGFSDPGTRLEAYGGSFGRYEATLEHGAHGEHWGYYLLANRFAEGGWRDNSNTTATSFFGALSRRGEGGTLDLHLAHARTHLLGNGAQSLPVLALARDSVFTGPDQTNNDFTGFTAQGTWHAGRTWSVAGTLFAREGDTHSYNGDGSIFESCEADPALLCEPDGAPVLDQHGQPIGSQYDAIINDGLRQQLSRGGNLQAILKAPLAGHENQLVAGVDYYHGRVAYHSTLQATVLDVFPSASGLSHVARGTSGEFVPADALSTFITSANSGLFLTDTWSVTKDLALTASLRFNHTHVHIEDRSGLNPDLDGDHAFERLNPSLGLAWSLTPSINLYAGYSESTRAPTPVELTCASPEAPCKLPNDFVADPPLKQVMARNLEIGLRSTASRDSGELRWHAGLFRTVNVNDILFQSTGGAQSNEGFYANVGRTRRQGLEASLEGTSSRAGVQWYLNYTRLEATFRSGFLETSASNPLADPTTGLIAVTPGNRIPGLPRDAFKVGIDWRWHERLRAGLDLRYNGPQFYRGDEANRIVPVGGFGILNARIGWSASSHLAVFVRAENLLDRHYADFGILGNADSVYPQVHDPRFVGPGGPRAVWAGFSLQL